jgi:hypothetical protein
LTLEPIVPKNSWGHEKLVSNWLYDVDNRRTKFVDMMEKTLIWEELKA